MTHRSKPMDSPVGRLTLIGGDAGLAAVLWETDTPARVPLQATALAGQHPILNEAEQQLTEYFAGQRRSFSIPLDFVGTPFQKQVWQALIAIPYGETRTYAELARQIGQPAAVRAVGAANGKNPISIIAPCHRVIGASGKLTGFAGGLAAKAWLLDLEGRTVGESASLPLFALARPQPGPPVG